MNKEVIKLGNVARIYVGADNVKNMVDRLAVFNFIEKEYEGATFTDGQGMYKREFEDCMVITVVDDNFDSLYEKCQRLKTVLNQESIGLERNNIFYLVE